MPDDQEPPASPENIADDRAADLTETAATPLSGPKTTDIFGADPTLKIEVLESSKKQREQDELESVQRELNPEDGRIIYRLIERLGEGGMGVVYKAEQRSPIRRTVAVKVIKPGFDSAEVIARFESERQALARMDHPNIAKVLDADTDRRGRPYFVMEYVPGHPITTYADDNRLSIKQRLELVLQVCDAIGHAHAKAIIHRDIKARNVLAHTTPDGPRIKVIDFGVAKALTSDRLTDCTFNTARGQAIGTYECMSPEQAAGSPDIDTRTDVYSLGVLLYELLSGSKPFDKSNLAKAADDEIRRIIREDEPPRPSTQLSSMGANATKIAKARQVELEALTWQLKSELDWIPLMALRKERERRYATPQQMAEDIRNYLGGKPLIAAPDSRRYRLGKFARRNKGLITAIASVALVLILGITGTSIGFAGEAHLRAIADGLEKSEEHDRLLALHEATEAQRQQKMAEQEAATAKAVIEFQIRTIQMADPEQMRGDKVTVLDAVKEQLAELDEGTLKKEPAVESRVREMLGQTLTSLGRYDLAEADFRRALEIRRSYLPAASVDAATSLGDLASAMQKQGKNSAAEPLFRESLAIQQRLLPPNDFRIATTSSNLAIALQALNRKAEAETLFRRALEIDEKSLPVTYAETATVLNNLAGLLDSEGKSDEAETLYRRAIMIDRISTSGAHPSLAIDLSNFGVFLEKRNKLAEAGRLLRESVDIARKTLSPNHPDLASALNNLGVLQRSQHKPAEAESSFREAITIFRLNPSSPRLPGTLDNLAKVLLDQRRAAEAEPLASEALADAKAAQPPDDRKIAGAMSTLALVLDNENRRSEAEPLYRESLRIRRTILAPGDPDLANSIYNFAVFLQDEHRPADAEPLYKEALQIERKALPAGHPTIAMMLDTLASVLSIEGKNSEAEQDLAEALRIRRPLLDKDAPEILQTEEKLALLYFKGRNFKDAAPLLSEAAETRQRAVPVDEAALANDRFGLGRALMVLGNLDGAEKNLRAATDGFERKFGIKHAYTIQAATLLAQLLEQTGRATDAMAVRSKYSIHQPATSPTPGPP